MNPELLSALKEQAEARAAYNSMAEDAAEKDVTDAADRVKAADQAVVEACDRGATAPAELRDRISLGRYLTAVATEKPITDGAEAELRAELNLSDEAIPLEALLPTPEERADAVSPEGTDGNALAFGTVNQTTGPLLNRVFTATDAAFLGVAMPTVPPGERVYPVMTDGTDAAMAARGDAAPDATAAKFAVVNATPKRLSGRYVFDLEGVATLGGLLESTLRADLRTVMGYQMDRQVLLGSGAGANVSGIATEIPLTLYPGATFSNNDVAAVIDWDAAKEMTTGSLDGKFARTEGDLRFLIGQATYNILRTAYRGATTDNQDALAAMRALGARVALSFQIPAPAKATIPPKSAESGKKVQWAVLNTEPAAAVAPMWQGITMIRDPYSNADKAQIVLTAHALFDFVMRRKDGWKRYAIRTES